MSGDAYHITAPAEDGDGAFRCMKPRSRRAGITAGDIDYINAHGTSTPLGDEIELKAVERLVGNAAGQIAMSSTKSSIGHLLGAAGAVEAIFCHAGDARSGGAADASTWTIRRLRQRSIWCRTKLASGAINVVLSNSFGFGGTNASLVFRRMASIVRANTLSPYLLRTRLRSTVSVACGRARGKKHQYVPTVVSVEAERRFKVDSCGLQMRIRGRDRF